MRAAVLLLLQEEPMHGYQLMQAIAERSGGRWQPSPGAIYPTLNQLEDEGLITVTASAGRRLATLTGDGRALVQQGAGGPDPFAPYDGGEGFVDLRDELGQLHGAVREVGRTGTPPQVAAAAGLLRSTRRSLYRLLAEDAGPTGPTEPEAAR